MTDQDRPWLSDRRGAAIFAGATLIVAGLAVGGLAVGSRAYAESTMSPIDHKGRMIDNGPPPPGLTLEERVERLERRSTAHCLSGYRLEANSEGLICVRPSR